MTGCRSKKVEMDSGKVCVRIGFDQKYYYEILSELTGTTINGEYELISTMKELAAMKEEFSQIRDAFTEVKNERIRGCMSEKRGDYAG